MKIIDGKKIAETIKDKLVINVAEKCDVANGERPNLAIILVGERPDSKLYVNLKIEEAKKVGIDTHLYECDNDTKEEKLIELIQFLNSDPQIDAILIQLPLPKHFDTNKIILTLNPNKDADGFHPKNLESFLETKNQSSIPPVYAVVLEILNNIKCDLKNKKICIISNSEIFGKNLATVLKCYEAKVSLANPNNDNLTEKTKKADILISAVGIPGLIKKEHVKKDAILIDIGISKKDSKILGDIDSNSVKNLASYITPVPGGVGPITIAMLFKNTLRLHLKNQKRKNQSP